MAPQSRRRPGKPDAEQAAAPAATADADALLAAAPAATARAAARIPNAELADLPDLELLEEAHRRGVTFTRAVTREQIIAAAKAAVAE